MHDPVPLYFSSSCWCGLKIDCTTGFYWRSLEIVGVWQTLDAFVVSKRMSVWHPLGSVKRRSLSKGILCYEFRARGQIDIWLRCYLLQWLANDENWMKKGRNLLTNFFPVRIYTLCPIKNTPKNFSKIFYKTKPIVIKVCTLFLK